MEQAHDSQWAKELKSVHNLFASTASKSPSSSNEVHVERAASAADASA